MSPLLCHSTTYVIWTVGLVDHHLKPLPKQAPPSCTNSSLPQAGFLTISSIVRLLYFRYHPRSRQEILEILNYEERYGCRYSWYMSIDIPNLKFPLPGSCYLGPDCIAEMFLRSWIPVQIWKFSFIVFWLATTTKTAKQRQVPIFMRVDNDTIEYFLLLSTIFFTSIFLWKGRQSIKITTSVSPKPRFANSAKLALRPEEDMGDW